MDLELKATEKVPIVANSQLSACNSDSVRPNFRAVIFQGIVVVLQGGFSMIAGGRRLLQFFLWVL